ncbi:MAG TPA: enoyl-CoA hydratase-related protein [Pseudomonas sp.]
MSSSPLVVERAAGVVQLRFNRPESLNALDVGLAEALLEACRSLASDSAVRVVVLSGNGRAFMAGGDLAAMRAAPVQAADALIQPLHQVVQLLANLPVPVLASVQGVAAGAGMSLALGADLAIAAEGTRFNFAYTDIATSCDGGASWALPRLLGLRKALEIALLCESFDAAEALRLGLVSQVVAPERLAEATQELAERLASRAPQALAQLKRLLRASAENSLAQQLQAEHAAFLDCAQRPEFVTAIDAFYARRARRSVGG